MIKRGEHYGMQLFLIDSVTRQFYILDTKLKTPHIENV